MKPMHVLCGRFIIRRNARTIPVHMRLVNMLASLKILYSAYARDHPSSTADAHQHDLSSCLSYCTWARK